MSGGGGGGERERKNTCRALYVYQLQHQAGATLGQERLCMFAGTLVSKAK